MRLFVLFLGGALIAAVIYHEQIEQKLSDTWNNASYASSPQPVIDSMRSAGSATGSLMDRAGGAMGR